MAEMATRVGRDVALDLKPNPQHDEKTVSVSTITDVYHCLIDSGLSAKAICQGMGLDDPEDIHDPDARVPADCLPRIWELMIAHSQNPAAGLMIGSEVCNERLSILAQAFMQSESLQQGIELYQRFHRLASEAVKVSLLTDDKQAELVFDFQSQYAHRSEIERTLLSGIARARYVSRIDLRPKEVHFNYPAPEYAAQYERFFHAPVRFEQEHNAILFSAKLLQEKPKSRNPYLYRVLTQHAERLLKGLHAKNEVLPEVRRLLKENLCKENLDVEQVARAMNMSRHTLYRKLKLEHTSFQTLLDEVRQSTAIDLVLHGGLKLSEVAFLTGFSELSAFSRAFKRWTGISPAQYRKENSQ